MGTSLEARRPRRGAFSFRSVPKGIRSRAEAAMPGFIDPQLAILSDATPSGRKWVHEVKFDGYRIQVHVERRKVTVYTRRGEDWTARFPDIAKAARVFPECIIDGEAIVPDMEGRSDFSALQSAVAGGNAA